MPVTRIPVVEEISGKSTEDTALRLLDKLQEVAEEMKLNNAYLSLISSETIKPKDLER